MILMNDFKAEPEAIRVAMQTATQRVIDSGWYVLGKEVEKFETLWASTCGVPYGVGVGNGMDAIEIALRALDIGVGDEVITTSMTAFATVLGIIRAGATPILADIDPTTALLSPASVQRCLSPKTKALVLVHLYGQVRNMDTWVDWCQQQHIALVEDCAQAHLASSKGKTAGSFGQAGAYSFYPTKNLGALGDAGMVVTHTPVLAEKMQRLRNYGQSTRYYHPEIGLNSRLDELQAAILMERYQWLRAFTQRRMQIAQHYLQAIENPYLQTLAPPEQPENHVYHLFVLTCQYRDQLHTYLQERGIQTLIHYPIPVHQQTSLPGISADPQGMVATEAHTRQALSIPCHPQMSDQDVAQVTYALNQFQPDVR